MKCFVNIFVLMLCCWSANILLAEEISFQNIAGQMGIDVTYAGPSFGGGVSFCDFNGDGYDDLTLAGWSNQNLFFFQNDISAFNNVIDQTTITNDGRAKTVLWADFDNDGDKDFFVAKDFASNKLYRNEGGYNFVDVTEAAGLLSGGTNSIAACVADYDNDGDLDLYVTNRSSNTSNELYRNNGDWTFTEVGAIAGVQDPGQLPLAVSFLDYDMDGWQDIYIANDRMLGNTMLRNNGDGTFEDVSEISNTNIAFDAMGIAIGDYDNDYDLDMYISNTEHGNGLLRNNGDGTFSEIADSLGVAVNRICWGVNFIDFDNDSDLDLFVCVNHPDPTNPDITNALFENNGDGTFTTLEETGMESDTTFSWGTAVGDFDNDGYCDIAVVNSQPTKFELWENNGGSNNWIKIKLEGTVSNRDAVGSLIEIHWNDRKIIRSTHCGISYLSQNSDITTVGLGTASLVDSIVVNWPAGGRDVRYNLAPSQVVHIVESSSSVGITDSPVAIEDFELLPNYPNPFNPSTNIQFRLATSAAVQLSVYNLQGKRVRTLVSETLSAGLHTAAWDGKDRQGKSVTSGLYIYKINVGNLSAAGKMILLK